MYSCMNHDSYIGGRPSSNRKNGELLEEIVFGGLGGSFPENLTLYVERDVFFEEGDAVLARVM